MLDAFLKLIDYSIALVREPNVDRAALFKDLAEPLFLQLQPIVDDYFDIFLEAEAALRDKQLTIEDVRSQIEKRRTELLPARRVAQQLAAAAFETMRDRRFGEFCVDVADFFGAGFDDNEITPGRGTPASYLVATLGTISAAEHDVPAFLRRPGARPLDAREEALELVMSLQRRIEKAWEHLAGSYARLRIESLAPNRYRRATK